jgi:hypothetical protein
MPDYGNYALEDICNKNITTKTLMNLIIRKIINIVIIIIIILKIQRIK